MKIAAVAAGLFLIASAAHAATPEIALVKTMPELRKGDVIKIKNWDLKFGIGDSGKDGGSWVVVYCDAKWTGEGKVKMPPLKGALDPLGPVYVEATSGRQKALEAMMERQAADQDGVNFNNLFCYAVPIAGKGARHIVIKDEDGKEIARRELEIKEEPKNYWHLLMQPGSWAPQTYSAYPKIDGRCPVFPAVEPEFKTELGEGREGMRGLPWDLPPEDAWGIFAGGDIEKKINPGPAHMLKLSLVKNAFQIESTAYKICVPGSHIARWWVNGKPVEAKKAEGFQHASQAMHIENRLDDRIPFSLPEILGELKAGDTIGLQVMHCPAGAGIVIDGDMAMLAMSLAPTMSIPLISEKIEFKLTDELIKQAGDRKEIKTWSRPDDWK